MTEPMPQIYNHCVAVYKAMDAAAETVDNETTGSQRIWRGFLTKLINEDCGLAVPYYSAVRNNLVRMGCIEQLNRGGGTHPSLWLLLRDPTEELFNAKGKIRTNSKASQLTQQVADLNTRVERLENLLKGLGLSA